MSFDIFIVVCFLVLTLIVGLGHGKKVTTIKDYAIGNKNFSTGALVATIVATWASGSNFAITLSEVYSNGLYDLIASSAISMSLIIMACIFIPRMSEFLGSSSIAETIGNLYGQKIRMITAFCGIIASIGIVAVQFKVFGSICYHFLGFSPTYSVIIAAIITTIYSAFGGIRSVTLTDILQLIIFGVAIPIIGIMIWNKFHYDGFTFANSAIDNKFNLSYVFDLNNPKLLQIIPLMFYFTLPSMEPSFCQRILMGKNIQQVKKAFLIAAGLLFLIQLMISWIPFLIFNVDPKLAANQLISYIVDNYTYIGLKGLIIVGVISMAMSTADSNINTSSVLFAHDLCKPLGLGKNRELFLSKIFALIIGIFGMYLALSKNDLLSMMLIAKSFYIPIVTAPLMLSILGFRTSRKSVMLGMAAGFATVIIWNLLDIAMNCIVIAMLVNLVFLMGSHYLLKQPGGWVTRREISTTEDLEQKNLFDLPRKKLTLSESLSFIRYCLNHSPTNQFSYVGLGIYVSMYTIATMYATRLELDSLHHSITLGIYQVMLIFGIALFSYPVWPNSISHKNREIAAQILYPVAIFLILILANSFFAFVSGFSGLQFVMFSINLLIAATLLGWRVAPVAIVVGFMLALILHQYYNPAYQLDVKIGSPSVIYSLFLISAAVVLFLKPREEQVENMENKVVSQNREINYTQRELEHIRQGFGFIENQLQQKEVQHKAKTQHLANKIKMRNEQILNLTDLKDEFLSHVEHKSTMPLTVALTLSKVLHYCYDALNERAIKNAIKNIVISGDRLKSYINNIFDKNKRLSRQNVNLSNLVKERPNLYKKIFSVKEINKKFSFDVEDNIIVYCDEYYITQVIDNLISNALIHSQNNIIKIILKKIEDNKVRFDIVNQGKIAKKELLNIFSAKSKTSDEHGLGLALCKSIIEAHDGSINASYKNKITTFTFILADAHI